jgi:hypothetical protein
VDQPNVVLHLPEKIKRFDSSSNETHNKREANPEMILKKNENREQ